MYVLLSELMYILLNQVLDEIWSVGGEIDADEKLVEWVGGTQRRTYDTEAHPPLVCYIHVYAYICIYQSALYVLMYIKLIHVYINVNFMHQCLFY